jgi:tetratricopeptide (TPR) repeat protein
MANPLNKKLSPPEANLGEVTEAEKIPPGKSSGVSWPTLLQALVIAAAVFWIYQPALQGDWLWDDDMYITANSLLHDPARLWKIWFVPGSQIEYYPIEASVQWIQWHLWGMDTLGYHLTNVFLHMLSALLVWRLLSKFGLRLAWLGGLIFAVHPVMVESVAWIAELKNTLSLPPFLLAMCAWIDFDERGRRRDYWLALGLFLVAMLCKTTMVMFPVVILLYAWWKRGRIGWKDVRAGAPFFLVSLALGLTSVWQQDHVAMPQSIVPLGGIFARLARAGLSLSFYFSKCFLPVELMPIYPRWVVDPPALWQFLPWPVLGGALYWLWTRRQGWGRHALLGGGFFLLFLAPFLGFSAGSYMAFTWVMDHFLYIPIIGLIGLVVAALEQVKKQLPASFRSCGIAGVTMILALLAFGSRSYAKMFFNSETLWTYELRHNPEASPAYNNLGGTLLQIGRTTEAINLFEQVSRIQPDSATGYYNLGNALQKAGRFSEAIEPLEQSLRINPGSAAAHNCLGDVLFQTGRAPEAIGQYEQALQIDPNDAGSHYNLGSLLQQSGRLPEAIEQFEEALRIKSDYADAHNNLGMVLFQTGQASNAAGQFALALQLKPDDAGFHNNLGLALLQTGQGSNAIGQFQQALQIKPDYVEASYNLANALLQAARIPEAIEQYEKTLQLKPDYAEAHNNLGAALLQAGRRSEAEAQFQEALRIRPDYPDARNNLAHLQAFQKTPPAKN